MQDFNLKNNQARQKFNMMTLATRIEVFSRLGEKINALAGEERDLLLARVRNENPWFTPENVNLALAGIARFLDRATLQEWISQYNFHSTQSKKIGVAMAGNIPLVGFHDLLCVLISGHQLMAKLSTQDTVLMHFVRDTLVGLEPAFGEAIRFEERLNACDAFIATGSDNSARYFEYYFRKVPHIIRKNRTSCAVILGEEPAEEFVHLGADIFSYFGLGCRNVSKIYVPEGFDFIPLLDNLSTFHPIAHHHKYANNYDYQKSILLVNQTPFLDNGFLLVTESQQLVSPIAVLFFEYYKNQEVLQVQLVSHQEKLQCIVSAKGWYQGSIPFGQAQFPAVSDYADGVDTLAFLQNL